MILNVALGERSYDIVVERGALFRAAEYLNLERKVLVVTDSGVPAQYANTVASFCGEAFIYTLPEGESSKSFEFYQKLLSVMVKNEFTRSDCVVAVGGGVVGDLAGFVASSYMRGVDFYNIPTTLLSQIDSSIGGKVAIDFEGYKNIVGAFYQPKKVLIDPNVLDTLEYRQVANGMAEAIKMALTSDAELFELFESGKYKDDIETVIIRSLMIKKNVVELDERESGLRKILNFGHTVGHAIESVNEFSNLYHGECVAIGMVPMCSDEVRERLLSVLRDVELPCRADADTEKIVEAIKHDKKASGDKISLIYVNRVGEFEIKNLSVEEFTSSLKI